MKKKTEMIRLSKEITDHLDKLKKNKKESYDVVIARELKKIKKKKKEKGLDISDIFGAIETLSCGHETLWRATEKYRNHPKIKRFFETSKTMFNASNKMWDFLTEEYEKEK